MKIKTKLQLIIIAVVILVAGIVSLNLLGLRQTGRQFEQQALIMELHQAIFERARFREEYFLYRTERAKEQFLILHKKIGGLLERMSGTFIEPEDKVLINSMTGFQTQIGNGFNGLVMLNESAKNLTAAAQALRERIISQMLVNAHSLYSDGAKLLDAANKKTMYQHNIARLYSNIAFGLLALFIITFTLIIMRSITYPLMRLHKGTDIIAGGDLDYKINIRTPDEIGQLSRAFDFMTEHLKRITVSRDDLNKEIEERKQAEEALRQSRESVERLAEEMVIIAEIGRVIGSTLDIDEVYDRFAAETKKLIPFDNLIINLIKEEENELVITYVSGIDIPSRRKGELIPFEGSITEMQVRSGRGIIIQSENIQESVKKYPSRIHVHNAGLRSMLSAPLISADKVFGVLVFRSKKPNAYTEQDLRLAEKIGMQIAGAIANARLFSDRKRAEEKIKASLLEKETMLKEIHHRVKNNLQVISSLLNMQSSYLEDEKAKEALQASMARVKTMAMIHTQLYQSQDLTRIDFGHFIRDLIGNISQSYGRTESPVEIKVNTDEVSLGIDTSIPCGLILNELVSNALKHAFPEGKEGEINIRMRSEDTRVALTVMDNGIGFPESVDVTNLKSLGLELVNLLVGQINGKIDMRVDGGTTWTIAFPIKNEREWRDG